MEIQFNGGVFKVTKEEGGKITEIQRVTEPKIKAEVEQKGNTLRMQFYGSTFKPFEEILNPTS